MSVSVARLPSMDLIYRFVIVGRRMSITLAAGDLFVTQSAVSRQIHALEEALGVNLLVRSHRSIAFTPEGERLFEAADAAVRQLQEVVGSIGVARDRRPVTVSMPTGFAGLWMLPRMGHFQQTHPDIDLRLSAVPRIVNLRNEGIDLAVRYCPRSSAPAGSIRLFGETIAPVAHPSLGANLLDEPGTLSGHFLLEFDDPHRYHLQWADWLTTAGWTHAKPKGVLRFNQYDQVIQAALAGQGIALGRLELLGSLLADGHLVTLSKPRRAADNEYANWLVQGDDAPREDVLRVIAWIRAQVAVMDSCEP